MVQREKNALISAYKCIKEQDELAAKKHSDAIAEAAKKHQDAVDKIYNIRESRELKRRAHSQLVEDCKNDALAIAIKAIYIEALDPASLTDEGLFLAESMVDNWVREKGGASAIIASCRNKTYLLNKICSVVEDVALENVRIIEADESEATVDEQDKAEEEKKAKVTQMLAQANALIAKATAIQNGDESVLDDTDDSAAASEEAPAEDSGEEVDLDQPVEGETEEAGAEAEDKELPDEADPDFGDTDDNAEEKSSEEDEKEAEKSEEKAEEEIEDSEKSEEESEEKEKEEEDDDKDDDDDKEDKDDDEEESDDDDDEESELSDTDEDSDIDDSDVDPLGDVEELEAGEEEDQQEAEEELTGDSLDDEDEVEADDEPEVEDSVDGENTAPEGKIFDELEKEEDVQKAVELIRQRVADAEEDFIKRNAEDKKKIDDLLGKISDNIKTVEDISDNDSTKSKIAQESTMMYKRKIKSITENRPQSVFERMARKLTEGITKDSDLRAVYLAESGRADMASVVETTRVMYGFMEALRTLQLEKVDENYIATVLKEM